MANSTTDEFVSGEILRAVPTIILLGVLIVIGIVGNGLVLFVYHTRIGRSTIKYFITFLCALNMYTCVVSIPLEIYMIPVQFTMTDTTLCKISRFSNSLGTTSTALILLSIGYERYRKICRPTSSHLKFVVVRNLCIASFLLGLVISVLTIPVTGKYTLHIHEHNTSLTECTSADDASISLAYISAGALALLFVVTVVILTVIYTKIVFAIRRYSRTMNAYKLEHGAYKLETVATQSSSVTEEVDTNGNEQDSPRRHKPADKDGNQKSDLEMSSSETDSKIGETSIEDDGVTQTNKDTDVTRNDSYKDTGTMSYRKKKDINVTRKDSTKTTLSVQKSGLNSLDKALFRTVTLMILLSLVFVLCYFPIVLLLVLRQAISNFREDMSADMRGVYRFVLRTYFMCVAIDPLVYGIYDLRFRSECKKVFIRLCNKHPSD